MKTSKLDYCLNTSVVLGTVMLNHNEIKSKHLQRFAEP